METAADQEQVIHYTQIRQSAFFAFFSQSGFRSPDFIAHRSARAPESMSTLAGTLPP